MDGIVDILRIIAAIAIAVGLYHFYRAYKKSKLLLPEELGAVSTYTEQAGGDFGNVNWTIPFVRVSCYKHFVAIRCWNYQFVLKKGDVQRIKKEGIVSDGVTIVHSRYDLPDELVIWPRNITKLMAAIETSLNLPTREEVREKRKGRTVRYSVKRYKRQNR